MTKPRVFGVSYQFLACGAVFTDGLAHAAEALGVPYAHAAWSDAQLAAKVEAFAPDLLFVVHGRRFIQRWRRPFPGVPSAVWLLDEPYEVDDTARFSARFDQVFVNDPATLARHPGSVYLPVCYDPAVHVPGAGPRPHTVGFIGGGNPARERALQALAVRGMLIYVIGGPWRTREVQAVCRSRNIPAAATADWYRDTQIVINVFRDVHHYNRQHIAATSLNPRVYEALACGALVVSEWRPEIATRIPDLPTFRTTDECVELVAHLLAHPVEAEARRRQCVASIAGDTYQARLSTVLATVAGEVAA